MTHYFTNESSAKSNLVRNIIWLKDRDYFLYTDNGIFSKTGLDFGTRILIENLPVDRMSGNILDMGCGYGPIGIYLASNTKATIHMVDVNLRAIHLSKMNAKENKLNNVEIYESDVYKNVKEKFLFIVTNPPIRAGKKVVYEIIFNAKNHLEKNGELWLVIRKDQGANSLLKDMEKTYLTETVYKKNGFFVISAKIR